MLNCLKLFLQKPNLPSPKCRAVTEWNYTKMPISLMYIIPIVIGIRPKIWNAIDKANFLRKHGLIPKAYFKIKHKLLVLSKLPKNEEYLCSINPTISERTISNPLDRPR